MNIWWIVVKLETFNTSYFIDDSLSIYFFFLTLYNLILNCKEVNILFEGKWGVVMIFAKEEEKVIKCWDY